ncbi:uncharacterized protein G6M90_00g001470 [Metarhizium brunneum]|uniref:Uncharacterized protein n=1 Tax=Metarhizium brunneum TaxID=500148 RepID=A0A7D5YS24_9HYPO|nr:hypothetical protein G6M90_00g001470 [Metarhizium brunneum]
MLSSATESNIDDLDESKLSKVDENSPSNNTDSQQFNSETIDCLMVSNVLYRIVEALDPEMLDIRSTSAMKADVAGAIVTRRRAKQNFQEILHEEQKSHVTARRKRKPCVTAQNQDIKATREKRLA